MTTSFTPRVASRAKLSTEAEGISVLAQGDLILLHHDDRIVFVACAGTATTEQVSFIVRHSTGFVQVALHERDCDRLLLPESTPTSRSTTARCYGQCVTVDAASGVSTGISGADRARTARTLADSRSRPEDLARPGHLVPVRVGPEVLHGLLTVAAAALTLTDAALPEFSGAVFADLEGIGDPTTVASVRDAESFADQHHLTLVTTAVTTTTAHPRIRHTGSFSHSLSRLSPNSP